ncbi:hypothetical protein PSTT_14857 [Puccinia striiformis]|uniref:Uncharacterized protein n=1 Tax=Puccinia striiformis TaxID=27350 RepID=A0A2S4UKD2_9BASI|nr:hypothetical protein PSTT_14857 [Puccinia striiformis]
MVHEDRCGAGVHKEFSKTSPGVLRDFSGRSPRVLREFSESSPRVLREFSETPSRILRDFSETSLTHLRDFSETSPENPTLGFPRWVTKPSIGFPRLVTSRVTFPSVGGEPIAISSVACNRSFVCSVQLATELPLIGCWWPRLSRLTTNRSFELVGWVPNQFQLACSAAELESDGTTLGDRPTEVGSDADCIGSAHASLDRLGTSQINWDAPNRCLYAGSAVSLFCDIIARGPQSTSDIPLADTLKANNRHVASARLAVKEATTILNAKSRQLEIASSASPVLMHEFMSSAYTILRTTEEATAGASLTDLREVHGVTEVHRMNAKESSALVATLLSHGSDYLQWAHRRLNTG